MQHILIVEDAPDMQLMLKSILGTKYELTLVASSEAAQKELTNKNFSLIILDIGLEGENGLQFCAKLRLDPKYKNVTIVFLTGKDEVSDKVLGFSVGADDYITKPFHAVEFSARIDSKMRRIVESSEEQEVLHRGIFKIKVPYQKILISTEKADQELDLTPNEFKLLYFFIQHEEHVLSREQILDQVWGTNVHVSDRTVDTHIYSLRNKLGRYSTLIEAVPRQGYRFIQRKLKRAA